ncbi:diacylglycerol/lipid kinase family protein [Treponema pectinovorum]|uniref:diacylglycerol/lipid kinase family protein n=1 Tax=Treponema pectinovorum TaxID=164 RepID=UPI0011F2D587|nr:YegS/Rv2252/BmrU family lipid kinase [Treponema pectinovorum]
MYYFIVNEYGGSGQARRTWERVQSVLDEQKIKYQKFVPECKGYSAVLAEHISELEDDDIRLVVVGGDGTVNEVLNGIRSFERIKFGVIPTGSGNDFCRGLKLPLKDVEKITRMILSSKQTKNIDLGIVSSGGRRRIFAISSGFGLNAIVGTGINTSKLKVFMNKLHLNSMSYALLTIKTLFSMKTCNFKLSFDGEPLQEFDRAIFLAAMNFPCEGGGVPMAPNATANDGKLSFTLAARIPKWKCFFAFPFLLAAKQHLIKGFFTRDAKTLDVFSSPATISHTDGELFGNLEKIHYECLPQKLKLLI